MTETVHSDYEVKSEFAVCHWPIPVARLHDITPTPTNAACVTGLLAGAELCGTIISIDPPTPATATFAEIDFTPGMVYEHDVRTVLTYGGGPAEATWGTLSIGDPVFYDATATMVALGIYLSTSPLDGAGNANSLFGWIVPGSAAHGGLTTFDTDSARFPLAAGVAGNTHRVSVMQKGAGL
jgi:hypothetical protein